MVYVFFEDFQTKRDGADRKNVKERKKWRPKEGRLVKGGWRSQRKRRRGEKGKGRRAYRSLQTLHGSPPSHNNTTPSPLAATQLFPSPARRRRRSSCYPRLRHCSFPRSFPPTFPLHHLFSGCAAYNSPELEPYPRWNSPLFTIASPPRWFSPTCSLPTTVCFLYPSFILVLSGSFPFLFLILRPRYSPSLSQTFLTSL